MMTITPAGTRAGAVALIPARGGSKGLPGKNVRPFLGHPLIAWTIQAARDSAVIDRIVVSTDDVEIAAAAALYGAEVAMRPAELATDTASSADVARHHMAAWDRAGEGAERLVLVQPTSPLRTGADIDAAMAAFDAGGFDSLASRCEAETHPYLVWREVDGAMQPFVPEAPWARRQDMPAAWTLNGAIYVVRCDAFPSEGVAFLFGRIGGWDMPAATSVDIDTLEDFEAAEATARAMGLTPPKPVQASANS